jgi:hypothetical protein
MISIDRDRGYLVISRTEFIYRDGLDSPDHDADRRMGDGDILIPLPEHMKSREWDDKGPSNAPRRYHASDGQSAELIIAEIRKRLGCHDS